MRNIARSYGREVYCHRNALYRAAGPGASLVQLLSRDQRMATTLWLGKQGPFWDEFPEHDPNEWFECNGDVVTESGVAESAYCATVGIDRRLVSISPSDWEYAPVVVTWRKDEASSTQIDLENYWEPPVLEVGLLQADMPIESWPQLEAISRNRFRHLNFTADSFSNLNGQPFAPGVADRLLVRLNVLDKLWRSGLRSPEGQQLYQEHFVGRKAWFSDSSDGEKQQFRQALTFPSVEPGGESVFCPWHGKVNTPPYRIHFSWPVPPGSDLHVVYVGLKITRE